MKKNRGPVRPDHPVLVAMRNAPYVPDTEEERAWLAANPIDLAGPMIPGEEVTAMLARVKAYGEANNLPASMSVGEVLVMMGDESDEAPKAPTRYLDPVARAKEKQASRDEDERRLAAGEVTREELNRENNMFHGMKFRIDLAGAKKLY